MTSYPRIARVLRTVFDAQTGLSEDVARRLYVKTVQTSAHREEILQELRSAFSDGAFSWKTMLCNPEFEAYEAETEDEAREYARRILWAPLFEQQGGQPDA